ncbi:MAG: nucleotidyltransferase [Truepera sp.]|nr:nucleotidyltransferase [Truepera sp.]
MATTQLPPDFKEFLRLLNSKGVEYLLIGGYAVGYHGYPRATGDMDIWIAMTRSNAERVVAVLQEFGFNMPEVSVELFLEENRAIRMGVPPVRIEVITTISGVDFNECYAKRLRDIIDGVEVNIIDLADLKANKRASGRAKDIDDLENLS